MLNVPLEIIGFDFGGVAFLDAQKNWIVTPDPSFSPSSHLMGEGTRVRMPAFNTNTTHLTYTRFEIPLTEIFAITEALDWNEAVKIEVHTRLVGLDEVQMTEVDR